MVNIVVILSVVLCVSVAVANASSCGRLFENKVSENDKKIIVNKHNQLRGLIAQGKVPGQPKAKNLKNLKWDDKLAQQAQKIANLCEFKHKKVNDSRFYVGQNLGWTGSTASSRQTDWNGIIQKWFNEHKDFKYPTTSKGVTGHYTQVVWADTQLVGCGYTFYRKNSWYEKLYVCNYGPGGNYIGEAPYKI
ncbi:venom allergen 5-like [Tribolium madens]|uniref:venom allergen 5-like n=1 Tax=Tribolium madens TaxID=41895 RepID=UPI001CF74E7C|nr:venom allergen 5-like [Tribolium madens]